MARSVAMYAGTSLMDAEMGECPHGEAGAGILPALAFHR
jgi:hypothetical protein